VTRPRIHPRRWQPPKALGLIGDFAPNSKLAGMQRIEVPGVGPEDVAFDAAGTMYTGLEDGRIIARATQDDAWREVANTNGRPLGVEVDQAGRLVVCDAVRGLLRVEPSSGRIEILVDHIGDEPLIVANNASVGSDGTIYFSQSSHRYGLEHLKADLLEHGEHGRLFRHTTDGKTELLLDNLSFANGVCLAQDESYVLVAETGAYRVRKYWLVGERAGDDEIIIDNLPGFPDNISLGTDGRFWIAMPSERNALLDSLFDKPGFLRKLVWALPDSLQPDASRITFVIAIDGSGTVIANLQGDGQRFHYVTGVREHDQELYLGSLMESAIARVSLTGPNT
jgi:sugar lactone lactonase YvrE